MNATELRAIERRPRPEFETTLSWITDNPNLVAEMAAVNYETQTGSANVPVDLAFRVNRCRFSAGLALEAI
jgi:hypothetical protein